MPDADEPKQPSAAIDHDALLTLLSICTCSTERLADCLGVSVACHRGAHAAGCREHRNLHCPI